MTTHKKYIPAQKMPYAYFVISNRSYLLKILVVTLLFLIPLYTNAQNGAPTPELPPGNVNHAVQRLKHAIESAAAEADGEQVTALLQTAKDQHYLPGQVVVLCELAGINDGQQPDESAKNLQEAQQLAGEAGGDIMELSWAMGEVGKVQRYTSSKSADLRKGLTAVIRSLGLAMRTGKIIMHQRRHGKTDPDEADADSDDDYLSGLKQAKMITMAIKKGMPKTPNPPDWDFSDHWLDTLIVKGYSSRKTAKRLIAQKASRDSIRALSNAFAKKGDFAAAYKSLLTYSSYKDSLTAEVSSRRLAALQYNQQLAKKEAEIKLLNKDRQLKAQAASRQWFFIFTMFACIAALTAILLILNRNNRMKKRANEQLNAQKDELETALTELKSAQTQLVHSEKMASLGELTAGIAHEIQNPLNFVNNFSEVSSELIRELIENQQRPELDRELDTELLNDVDLNLQKVSLHGKRASAIIKQMLEHSRTGNMEKEQRDLDVLIEEYLNLSYHGMRARDKSFEVKIVTKLKSGPQNVNIVPQELGRVLLNIMNNAFYAVRQRQKTDKNGFEPTVTITSYREGGNVVVKVRDNGAGMPEQVMQKIFQPFFTTKPTGEGTGLGLSLSYDIITKGHGGQLSVASKENSYTEFTVVLPG